MGIVAGCGSSTTEGVPGPGGAGVRRSGGSGGTRPSTGDASIDASGSGASPGGGAPSDGGYRRPYGDAAVWNRPVSEFGLSPRSAEFADRCYRYCSLAGPGKVSTYFDDYSIPVYDAREATTTIRVFRAGFGYPGSIANGASIPWTPSWKPGGGNDHIMVILDPLTGKEIDLWTAYLPGTTEQSTCITVENIALGIGQAGNVLCAGGADVIQDETGKAIDYWTATTTYPIGGGYFEQYAMLVTAAEVQAGAIRHAMNLTMYSTMFGPQCSAADLADPTKAGETCGFWVNPASRLEWASVPQGCGANTQANTVAGRSRTVPEGSRFFIEASDAEIEKWLDSRAVAGALRRTARIFAVALRDYGMIVTNTSCYDAGILTSGRVGPDAPLWATLGVPADTNQALRILDGLITATNLRTAAPSGPQVVGSNAVH